MEVHFTPEQEARIAQVAANAGLDPEELVKEVTLRLLLEAEPGSARKTPPSAQAAAMHILELQKHVKPDPEGWTVKDYINYGRP